VHVISRRTLREYWEQHADVQTQLDSWYKVTSKAEWGSLVEVKAAFPHAELVDKCTVFNVKGNDYRLIVKINYEKRTVYIKGVYTHAEYSKDRWKNECNC
jgi:mRNA interferase HigB